MAYRAEIEIAVKGANQLSSFQGKLNESALAVDNLNKFLETFTNKGEGIVRSISNLTGQLGQAAQQFNEVALGTEEARTAAVNYLQATRNLNAGLQERVALLAEVAENERKLKLASAGIRETTQFSGPIGPGRASPVDALVGQSSNVEGLVKRNIDIRSDDLQLEQALLKLKERQADAVFEELKSSEALIRGANEAKLIAAEARGERPSSQLQILSPEQQLRQQGIERAEQIARDAALKSKANQEEFAAQKRYAREIFNIEQGFNKKLRNQEIDNILDKIKLESDLQEELFNKVLRNDNIALDNFDRRLKERTDELERQLNISKQIAKSSPIGGAENIPGSPAFLRARSKRRRDAASNALIGGAFPLLFGQGAGASLGGALGGGAGGLMGGQFGFGLSLVGTAVGQAFDTLAAKAADLGKALDPVNGNVDTIIQSLGLANTATGKYIKALEQVAGKQVALEEATKQLALVVGDEGVQALKEFGEATKDLGNAVSKFITQIAAEAAKLLQPATRATGNVISAISEQRAALSSSDPRLAGLQQEFTQNTGERTRAEITAELLETYREITREAEKEAEAKLAALDPSNAALETAERRLTIEQLNGDILNDQVFNLEKQQLAADLIAERTELRRKAEGDAALQATLQNRLKKLQVEYETALVALVNKRGDAEEEAAKKAKRAMERRMREFKRLQEEQQRADEQRKKQIDAAVIAELNSVNKLMSVDLQRVKVQDGEMAALKMRQTQITQELNNKLKILDVQYLQQVQNLKSVEEAEKLYQAYLNQHAALKAQADVERIQVINAEKRLTLAREQQVLDENRARRGQLEGVRQEGSRFSMQLDDPFNLNPERQRAFEAELRTFQILRIEREKLADLERKGRTLKLTESAENVKLLAEQIDRQKAFIPALEAELALRNELEAAAFKQAETIQKYGFLANELSTAMTSAVQAVVTGTGTVEEAFSTMFANIGKAFIDMATQMLAQKLFMTVLGAFAGGGGGGGLSGGLGGLPGTSNVPFIGSMPFTGFADGGTVMPGNTYMVGERGPELLKLNDNGSGQVINNNQLSSAMNRYRRNGSGEQAANSGASSDYAAAESDVATLDKPIDVRYSVERINSVDYVTANQFQAGLKQAAEQGERRAIQKLQMSPGTRRRLGI